MSNPRKVAFYVSFGAFWGMTATLALIDWRLGLISFVAGTLASTAQANENA